MEVQTEPGVHEVCTKTRANILQYCPEQVRLVSSLLHGTVSLSERTLFRLESSSFHLQTLNGNLLHAKLNFACCYCIIVMRKLNSAVLKLLFFAQLYFPGREKNTETARNGPYCTISTKNHPVRVFHLARELA